ncbi:penicillin acylase family protein [Bizionia sp.]|uniref:penicillin acylase family protein n=1 Tax=Bizionia sp. TaxID=1954480 RepID=UPI003A94FFEE
MKINTKGIIFTDYLYTSKFIMIKKILKVLVFLVLLILISGFVYTRYQKPTYSGTIDLKNISEGTEAYFDAYGIPHIYANNNLDAMTALGYLHAQDRLWQMELMKRIAPGNLSEILGEKLIQTDKFFKTLSVDEATEVAINKLDKTGNPYLEAMAYLDGVNQFIDEGPTPIEFTLAGVEKEHFTLTDIYNVFGYMAFSFAQAQKTDPVITNIKQKLGDDYLLDLDVLPNSQTTLIKNSVELPETVLDDIAQNIQSVTENLPIPLFIGSNSWVISPNKTKSGRVILANDPHIAYAQPAVWYEAHITTPNREIYGYYLAGIPFPVLGHNRNYAYGITMFENDDIDFYKEENHPTDSTLYKTADGYKKYAYTTKTIQVKDQDPIDLVVKKSYHGPIMTDIQDEITGDSPIAIQWVYTQLDNNLLDAIYKISHAKNMSEAKAGASLIHAPGLNIMYGDAKGNVAWWATGKLYKHKPHVNPKFILNGAYGEDDPIEYLDFKDNPKAENPNWGYVYSANNQPDSTANMLYPGYYLPENRAKRIVELLDPKNDWDMESTSNMMNDVTSPVHLNIIAHVSNYISNSDLNEQEMAALDVLKSWKGNSNTNEVAPTIYTKFIFRYLENTYKDELGETLFNQLLKTHLLKRTIIKQLVNDSSIWWNNIATNTTETKSAILTQSLKETVAALDAQLGTDMKAWTWGKVHTLEHNHALSAVEALKPLFNVGPFPAEGNKEVINNILFDYTDSGLYEAKGGPSTRRIIDFSDVENSMSILPTGQSGNPFSEHYSDQADMYINGEFRKMLLIKEEIIEQSRKIEFVPAK